MLVIMRSTIRMLILAQIKNQGADISACNPVKNKQVIVFGLGCWVAVLSLNISTITSHQLTLITTRRAVAAYASLEGKRVCETFQQVSE